MKYRYSAWYLRLLAFVLAAVCIAFGFLSGIATVYCMAQGYYFNQDKTFQTTWQCAEAVRSMGWKIIDQFRRNPDYNSWDKLLKDTDLRFLIVDEASGDIMASCVYGMGVVLPDSMANNPYLSEYNTNMALGEPGSALESVYVCDYYFGTDAYGNEWAGYTSSYGDGGWDVEYELEVEYTEDAAIAVPDVVVEVPAESDLQEEPAKTLAASYQILYLLPQNLDYHAADQIWQAYEVFRLFRSWSGDVPGIFAACILGFLAALVFLLLQAGHKPGAEELCVTWLERVPTDLLAALEILLCFAVMTLVIVAGEATYNAYITVEELWFIMGLCAAGVAACGVAMTAALCSCAVRLKQKNFWRSALVVRACAWVWRPFGKAVSWLWSWLVLGVRSIGMVPRAVLTVLGVLFVEFLLFAWLVNVWDPVFPLIFLVLFNLALLLAVIWGFAQMKILQKAAKALADGNLESKLDTSRMYWEFKQHGDNLNAIAGGMNKAVEQRMKSERLKTELITNVSHDIKTPLTSIVNYVDLLQKPHTEAEGIQYLEVLDRQSKRLKKLTENLVEASKASTGNLPVELAPTSVMELLNQAVEEYRDRLEAGRLEIVMDLRGDLKVQADGKHMWRILDNLLNNVIKYAMPGTRVYVTAQKRSDWVVIAVKNISRDPLNVDAEELMERFVRGDSARSTEGSGLGLNIARSLTVLQHGGFDLTVDGDLFKAEISLPAVQ